ncbi:hypothetical protein GLOIN_2v1790008 [Rhizophagus clarus]|uniref:Uncharacterized protein n=1 Tax=Rhizophagus clarus TaxID=94130 RepID=A0A8H3L841_9GLOM|nr:hypothetical protein GLOIN_2v1790008 [Rhizophagus clarus]
MHLAKSTLRPIAPKPQTTVPNSDVIAVNNGRKTEGTSSVEEETGWDDANTAVTKIFPGKTWEQIKNKLSRLVTKYNEIKEKENQTGREAQVKWKWFDRLDALFGTRENHSPGFLVDGFSDDVQLLDSFKEKETETKEENLAEKRDERVTKKRKSLPQDPLTEAMISARQIIWEKRLAFENEQRMEVERIKAETLRKKMEFDMEQSRMQYDIRMKELDLRMLQYKSSLE